MAKVLKCVQLWNIIFLLVLFQQAKIHVQTCPSILWHVCFMMFVLSKTAHGREEQERFVDRAGWYATGIMSQMLTCCTASTSPRRPVCWSLLQSAASSCNTPQRRISAVESPFLLLNSLSAYVLQPCARSLQLIRITLKVEVAVACGRLLTCFAGQVRGSHTWIMMWIYSCSTMLFRVIGNMAPRCTRVLNAALIVAL